MEYFHVPVLYDEVIDGLSIKPDGIYLDGTLGGGGHTRGILERLTTGRLIANDKDADAIENAKDKLSDYADKITYVHDDYKNIIAHLDDLQIKDLDGILLDLGVSSYQIDTAERGFSYVKDAPLDMRMDREQSLSAYDVVNKYSEKELLRVLYEYGEESNARNIVRNIIAAREKEPIKTTSELAELVSKSYPPKERYKHGNPAKKTFQAIRIEVNNELAGLQDFIYDLALRLKKGGRMCVITFHSLEDRIVKHAFIELEKDCVCDKKLPVCVCNKRREAIIITKKPILGEKEKEVNKRAESAKLRIIERV
ncbi:MAG: 16S rRNA (cytosine(1402)-N(4))-methyltransferase RsmH [Clostridiales bacterium]|nr:16S rRNA (cytosine(1402)-N(4))-methyltransferase RsmH [Clostridiales bacterium]MDY4654708.1 16S rRNA (cytosine(1402)-N(4))-methyltransferase RsmH [Eubacteriales bacterium]